MRLVFMGTPDFAVSSLRALLEAGHAVAGVFTQPDRPGGRGMKTQPSPVKRLAMDAGLPLFQPSRMRDGTALQCLRSLAPDLVVAVAYGRILPPPLLEAPPLGCVNLHGSLLPELRGAAPVQWAVARGYERTGVTTLYMSPEMDAGDLIYQEATDILPGDTGGSLYGRLRDMGAALLARTVAGIEAGSAPRAPQDHAKATYAPVIVKENGRLDFARPAGELDCLIRGMNPWPGAYSGGLKIHAAQPLKEYSRQKPGTMIQGADGVCVVCGDGRLLRLLEVQGPGGRRMAPEEYLRGHRMTSLPGD